MGDAAERTVEVAAPADTLFDVIVDFEAYPEFLADLGIQYNRVISQSDTAAEVESQVKTMGFTEKYTLRYTLERPRRVAWELVQGKLTKENRGSWEIEPLDEGRCRAQYKIAASFGWMVPKALVKKGIQSQLPKMVDAFKRRAEQKAG